MSQQNIEEHFSEEAILVFHFDVSKHSIPLSQFIETAQSAQKIVENFNKEFFDGNLNYQINVLAAEEGGLIELLGIDAYDVVIAGAGFLCTPPGQRYVKGLTGHETSYWLEEFGKGKRSAAKLLVELVKGFLEKNSDNLKKAGLTITKFRDAYQSKNRIYKACVSNPDVRGICFDKEHVFPIKRQNFPEHIVEVPDQKKDLEDVVMEWRVDTKDILVHSPEWKRDGRGWKADSADHKDITINIDDEAFWHHVRLKDITPDIVDKMRVQWAYPAKYKKPSGVKVLKVISYNGKKISEPLTPEELTEELNSFSYKKDAQEELF